MSIFDKLKSLLWHKYLVSRSKQNQRTWVWCNCGNEMVGDDDGQKNLSFIRDVYVENRNVVHYKCSKCGNESFFDFDHPAPISLPFTENDDIIERYRLAYCAQRTRLCVVPSSNYAQT